MFRKTIETTANLCVIVLAVVLAGAMVKMYRTQVGNTASTVSLVGRSVAVPGLQWQGSKSVVLAISTQCHFCTESMPFYQKLTRAAATKNIKVVAVIPQSADEGRTYLKSHDVHIDEIRQASLASLGVRGTPTLMIVDESGKISTAWTGKLDDQRELQVLSFLKL